MMVGAALVVFALSIAVLPRDGCGPLVLEMFGDRVVEERAESGAVVRYMCGSMGRTGVPVGVTAGLLGLWFVIIPGRPAGPTSTTSTTSST